MKQHKSTRISIVLFLIWMPLLFSSCEKIIPFDPSSSQPVLVLNAVPSAEKQLFVNFSYSHLFLDTSNYHPVSDADITVFVNGRQYQPTRINRCNYFFDYIPQEDDQLSIRILVGDDSVTASTFIPRKPRISTPQIIDTNSSFRFKKIRFNIDDHPNYSDYYRISISQRDSGCRYIPFLDKYDTIDTVRTTMFFCTDPRLTSLASQSDDFFSSATSDVLGTFMFTQLLTDDKAFDGQNISTTLYLMMLRDTNEVGYFLHQYILNIETITPERLRYLQSLNQSTSITQLITEPAPTYSNIHGGLGIFAGNAKYTYQLPIIQDSLWTDSSALSPALRQAFRRKTPRPIGQ